MSVVSVSSISQDSIESLEENRTEVGHSNNYSYGYASIFYCSRQDFGTQLMIKNAMPKVSTAVKKRKNNLLTISAFKLFVAVYALAKHIHPR